MGSAQVKSGDRRYGKNWFKHGMRLFGGQKQKPTKFDTNTFITFY